MAVIYKSKEELERWGDAYGEAALYVFGPILAISALVGGSFLGGYVIDTVRSIKYNKANTAIIREIETNIKESETLTKFKLCSIDCSKDGDDYYANVLGKAVVNEGDSPVFVSFKYDNLDQTLYNKINKYINTHYSFDSQGNIKAIDRSVDGFWPRIQKRTFKNILTQVAKVTKTKAIEKNFFGESEKILSAVAKSSDEDIIVRGISNVTFNDYKYAPFAAKFQIDTVKIEANQLISKRIEVEVDLINISYEGKDREELRDNPIRIYEFYAANPDKCTIKVVATSTTPIAPLQTEQEDIKNI